MGLTLEILDMFDAGFVKILRRGFQLIEHKYVVIIPIHIGGLLDEKRIFIKVLWTDDIGYDVQ